MSKDVFVAEQLALGNETIIEQVYTSNKQKFIAFALRYNVTNETALDVYQDAVVALMEHAKKGKLQTINSSVETYLFAIGKFMLFHYFKKKKQLFSHFEIDENIVWDDYSSNLQEQQTTLLQKHLVQLGEQCRKIITLFYYEEKKLESIVAMMGYENKEVAKSQKSRCLKQLKNLIQAHDES